MPKVFRAGQQRIVPAHSLDAYRARGWTSDDDPALPSEFDRKDVWESYAGRIGVDTFGLTKGEIIEACSG